MPEDPQLRAVFGVELLRTCKQICEEGLNVLYGMNAFQFDTFRHLKYMKPFRKWIQPTRFKNGTSMMWSSQTLTALSGLFDPLEEPEKVLYRPIQCFVRSIGKGNAARITVIHFRITLTPFGPFMPSSSQPHDTSKFIEKHNLIFNHTLTSLKELRIAGYWDDSLGKRALSVQRKWQSSPNNRVHYPIPGDLQSSQLFCKVTKNVETFAKRVPQGNFNQLHSNPSISLRPVLWSDIIELRKMNQRRDDNPTETSAD